MPFLRNPGSCQHYESSSGTEALQSTETEHPHVIFTMERVLPTVFFFNLIFIDIPKGKTHFWEPFLR